jgi:MarR family transcriptional regulator for hemolysin|tara:strand:- start:1626 stop:2117 length:492 start_codon:yes stop_codon:yes gene_type:complete
MKEAVTPYREALSGKDVKQDSDWIIRLGFLVHDAARLRRVVIDEKFKPLEITRSQAWLMAYVSREDGQTQSDLAEQMSLGKVAIGGLIDRLEKTQMIERRAELTDRRVRKIFLTEKGKKVILMMRDITMEANDTILAGLSIKQIKQAVKVLDKIKKNIESIID